MPGPQPYWCEKVGQYLTHELRFQCGAQIVDSVYDHYLKAWDELTDKPGRTLSPNYAEMTMGGSAADRKRWSRKRRSVFVPVPMFFQRTSGNAVPLIALSFHGVKFVLKTNNFNKAIMNKDPTGGKTSWIDAKTFVRAGQESAHGAESSSGSVQFHGKLSAQGDAIAASHVKVDMQVGYVYLGVAERNKFAEASFDILIDQVQHTEESLNTDGSKKTINNIGFNHCVQELIWVVTYDGDNREPMDYSGPRGTDGRPQRSVVSVQLKLNNSKRLTHLDGEMVPGDFFCQLDPYLHHTRVPENVYAYSFAVTPVSIQPSGACNMSRIDHSSFEIIIRKLETAPA